MKQINLPRLELQAALMLAHLTETVSAALSVKIDEKYFWSDSAITLGWILSSPTRWPTFVANRTSEIQRLTNDKWNHVLSGDNSADLISRGINPEDLRDQELWWEGPDWLSQSTENWPSKRELTSDELDSLPEARKCKATLVITALPDFKLFERYLSLHRLIKVTAYVKSAKKYVTRVIGEMRLTYEELYTILTQVDVCLNSRPLTPNSNDPNDMNPLTPGHFLIGDSLTAVSHPDLRDARKYRLNRYKHLQQMLQHFWQRWRNKYLSQFQQQNKWSQSKTNLLIPGAMVIVRDDKLPPMNWRLGRITEAHPGRDNVTRVVTIRLADSTIKQAASKIYVLPIDQDVITHPK